MSDLKAKLIKQIEDVEYYINFLKRQTILHEELLKHLKTDLAFITTRTKE